MQKVSNSLILCHPQSFFFKKPSMKSQITQVRYNDSREFWIVSRDGYKNTSDFFWLFDTSRVPKKQLLVSPSWQASPSLKTPIPKECLKTPIPEECSKTRIPEECLKTPIPGESLHKLHLFSLIGHQNDQCFYFIYINRFTARSGSIYSIGKTADPSYFFILLFQLFSRFLL